MNANRTHPLTVAFGEETAFDLPHPARVRASVAPAPHSVDLRLLTRRLVAKHVREATNPCQRQAVLHAAHEAESLAWLSSFPLLVLPELLHEKVRSAHQFAERQERLKPCAVSHFADAA